MGRGWVWIKSEVAGDYVVAEPSGQVIPRNEAVILEPANLGDHPKALEAAVSKLREVAPSGVIGALWEESADEIVRPFLEAAAEEVGDGN